MIALRKRIERPFSEMKAKEKILWFMFLRGMVTTLLLAITLIYQIKDTTIIEPQDLLPIYSLIGLTFLVNIFFTLMIDRFKSLGLFVISQIAYDILFTTALIFITGTQEAVFTFLYLFTITFSSILFFRTGALYTAAFASICFSTLLILDPIPNSEKHLLTLLFNNVAFFLVALLSGYLSEQFQQFRSKLKEEQESIRELEDLNKTIINNMTSGLLTTDLKNQIIYFNPAAEKMTGLSLSYIYKKNIFFVFPELKKHWIKPVGTNNKKATTRQSFQFKTSDDKNLTLGFSASRLQGADGTDIGHIVIFEDLTKILEMEQHLRRTDRLAAVGKLAAGIAHEIRNPLASVSGSIELLSREAHVNEEDKRLMNIVLKETDRLNRLVNEFLDYVRPTELSKESFDIHRVIDDTILAISLDKSFRTRSKIEFHPCQRQLMIQGNKEKIKQVLWNFLINAHQAMPKGGTITIKTDIVDGQLRIDIADEGIGMSEETVQKIFDPFFTTKQKGTGLGLSMVHKIIEAHQGRIRVSTKQGEGTTFSVVLPL